MVSSRAQAPSVTICGTFNSGLGAVAAAVDCFYRAGLRVLSPADPTPAEVLDGFLFVASDRHRDPRLVERRHLDAVSESDFVWLIAPDGYVGFSGAAEVAYAAGKGVPAFTADEVAEPAIACLVHKVASPKTAVDLWRAPRREPSRPSLLISPDAGCEWLHARVSELWCGLTSSRETGWGDARASSVAAEIRQSLSGVSFDLG